MYCRQAELIAEAWPPKTVSKLGFTPWIEQSLLSAHNIAYVLQHINATSGASSVFAMRLTITSAWSRMRRRERRCGGILLAGRLPRTNLVIMGPGDFRIADDSFRMQN